MFTPTLLPVGWCSLSLLFRLGFAVLFWGCLRFVLIHTVGMLVLEALQVENLTLRIGTSHSKSEAWDQVMKSPHV